MLTKMADAAIEGQQMRASSWNTGPRATREAVPARSEDEDWQDEEGPGLTEEEAYVPAAEEIDGMRISSSSTKRPDLVERPRLFRGLTPSSAASFRARRVGFAHGGPRWQQGEHHGSDNGHDSRPPRKPGPAC